MMSIWINSFVLSVPVAFFSWISFSSGLENVFLPLVIICGIVSFPSNLLVGLIFWTALEIFPSLFGLAHPYAVLIWMFYLSLIIGAHLNGVLIFSFITENKS